MERQLFPAIYWFSGPNFTHAQVFQTKEDRARYIVNSFLEFAEITPLSKHREDGMDEERIQHRAAVERFLADEVALLNERAYRARNMMEFYFEVSPALTQISLYGEVPTWETAKCTAE